MRTLITLMVVGILILAAGLAQAENFREGYDTKAVYEPRDPLLEARGLVTLQLSPMYMEIYEVNKASTETEHDLLVRVAACQDEEEVMQLVYRLERLDTDRQIAVLKIRVRYARLEGRHDQAFRLRSEMLELLQRETASLM